MYDDVIRLDVRGVALFGCKVSASHNSGIIEEQDVWKPSLHSIEINGPLELPLNLSIYNNEGLTLDLFEYIPAMFPVNPLPPHAIDNLGKRFNVQTTQSTDDEAIILPTLAPEARADIQTLIDSLSGIRTGNDDAYKYQDLLLKLLPYIFDRWLSSFIKEKSTNLNLGRIDITANNVASTGLFVEWRINLQATFIPMECKNFTNDISNDEINQINSRLGNKRSHLGFLFCRKVRGRKVLGERIKEYWYQAGNCIVVLEDKHIRKLVALRLLDDFAGIETFIQDMINNVKLGSFDDD